MLTLIIIFYLSRNFNFSLLEIICVQNLKEHCCAKLHEVVTLKKWLNKNSSNSSSELDDKSNVSITQNHSTGSSVADADYISWLVSSILVFIYIFQRPPLNSLLCMLLQSEHPSALSSFREIMNTARGKSIVVFLDYDGTLSPIVSDPDRAFMSNPVHETLFVAGLMAICILHLQITFTFNNDN